MADVTKTATTGVHLARLKLEHRVQRVTTMSIYKHTGAVALVSMAMLMGCARGPSMVGRGATTDDRRVYASNWQPRYIYGLFGGDHEELAKNNCENGDALVREHTSFGNALVTFFTGFVIVPKSVEVYCRDDAYRIAKRKRRAEAHRRYLAAVRAGKIKPVQAPTIKFAPFRYQRTRFVRRRVAQPRRVARPRRVVQPRRTAAPVRSHTAARRRPPARRHVVRRRTAQRRSSSNVRTSYKRTHVKTYKHLARSRQDCDQMIPPSKAKQLHVRVHLTRGKRQGCYRCVSSGKKYLIYGLRPVNASCQ